MRLIDADAFKQQVAAVVITGNLSVEKGNAMCELIDKQPTAYDVDSVHGKIAGYYDLVPGWALREIIKTVKSGGIEKHELN